MSCVSKNADLVHTAGSTAACKTSAVTKIQTWQRWEIRILKSPSDFVVALSSETAEASYSTTIIGGLYVPSRGQPIQLEATPFMV